MAKAPRAKTDEAAAEREAALASWGIPTDRAALLAHLDAVEPDAARRAWVATLNDGPLADAVLDLTNEAWVRTWDPQKHDVGKLEAVEAEANALHVALKTAEAEVETAAAEVTAAATKLKVAKKTAGELKRSIAERKARESANAARARAARADCKDDQYERAKAVVLDAVDRLFGKTPIPPRRNGKLPTPDTLAEHIVPRQPKNVAKFLPAELTSRKRKFGNHNTVYKILKEILPRVLKQDPTGWRTADGYARAAIVGRILEGSSFDNRFVSVTPK